MQTTVSNEANVMRYVVIALAVGRGRIHDYGSPARPWMYFDTGKEETAEAARRVFRLGKTKRLEYGGGYRYHVEGNDALHVLETLLPVLDPNERDRATRLLWKWGENGKPWPTEAALERAHRTYTVEDLEDLELTIGED